MNAFRYFAEAFGDLCMILWRYPSTVLWSLWAVLTALLCFITWIATRRAQSRDLVRTLQREYREQRAKYAVEMAAKEAKLAVYRDAAIRNMIKGLYAEGK